MASPTSSGLADEGDRIGVRPANASHIKRLSPALRDFLLVSLMARHLEASAKRPAFRDPKATELVERLGLVPKHFPQLRIAQPAVTIRTVLIDRITRAYLERFDDPTVVTFGAGLCTRYYRLQAPHAHWVDVDLPNSAAVRRELLDAPPNRTVIGSAVLDPRWGNSLRDRRSESTLFIAEGLLMFLDPVDVRALITRLAERYPGAELVVESIRAESTGVPHPLAPESADLRWTVGDFADVAAWSEAITLVDQWSFLDHHPDVPRAGPGRHWLRRFRKPGDAVPRILIGHLRFGSDR